MEVLSGYSNENILEGANNRDSWDRRPEDMPEMERNQ
jgi:hypothetical protein